MKTAKIREKPLRILICRLSAVGDCVHTIPVLTALRQEFPDAHIAWCTQPGPAQLLNGHPDLDELIEVPKGWLRRPRDFARLRSRLKSQFDVALDPQSLREHAGGALAFPRFDLGENFEPSVYHPNNSHTFKDLVEQLGDQIEVQSSGYALDTYRLSLTVYVDR